MGRSNPSDEGYFVLSRWFRASSVQAEARRGCAKPETRLTADRSGLAVVPEIDHRIGKGLEGVVQLAEAIKAKQQAPELVFPSKHPLDRLKALLKDRRIKAACGLAWVAFCPRIFGLMLGIMPRLKIALRLARQS